MRVCLGLNVNEAMSYFQADELNEERERVCDVLELSGDRDRWTGHYVTRHLM